MATVASAHSYTDADRSFSGCGSYILTGLITIHSFSWSSQRPFVNKSLSYANSMKLTGCGEAYPTLDLTDLSNES